MTRHINSWVALGDSYTIGEGVPLYESFPYQVLQLLRKAGLHFHAPEIVAKTGWTTFELAEHLLHNKLNDQYDFVTLMIGVNNQYRGLDKENFKADVEFLLKKSLHLTAGKTDRIIVLSIPDWSVTPFANGRDCDKIAAEIDSYNEIKKILADQLNIPFINITASQREAGHDATFLTNDKLHPSAKEYAKWAEKIFEKVSSILIN